MNKDTVTTSVAKVRSELQPHFKDNVDVLIYDYDFFTKLESIAKKEREKSKEKLLATCDDPKKEGVIIRTAVQQVEHKATAPVKGFNVEVFIELLLKQFPDIPKHKLRQCATEAVVPGEPRRSYVVEQIT